MKRTIEFIKDDNNYIFKENDNKKIEISISEKCLNGIELYNVFFKEYNIEDSFEIIDMTNDNQKREDKLCKAIYDKVSELFSNIEKSIKLELSDTNIKDNLTK